MKALMLEDKRKLTLLDVEDPVASANSQLISIKSTSIGGSEYLGFNNPGLRPLPSIMGHGFSGVTSVGKRVTVYPLSGCGQCQFCLADKVQLCDQWSLIGVQTEGGFAEKIAVPRDQLFDLPEDLTWEQSVFIEPFANAINAWEISNATRNDSIAIIGAGSIGLGIVAHAQLSESKYVHVAELSSSRRNAAMMLGASHVADKLTESYDIVFDTIGSLESRDQAISLSKKGGVCVFVGFETPNMNLNMSEIIRHQKVLKGSFVYSKQQFSQAIELAKSCDNSWVKNVSFGEVEMTLSRFIEGDFSEIKIALRPD